MKIKDIWNKLKKLIIGIKLPLFVFIFSFFGAFAGSHGTSLMWRRILLPIVGMVYAFIRAGLLIGWGKALWMIMLMARAGCYSMGYGIPDDNYPPHGDSGSDIGRFWTMLFRKKMSIPKAHRMADYFTRGTVAIMHSIALLVIPILLGNWIVYGLGCLGILLSNALISWRGWGSFKAKIFGKEVEFCWSDIIHYAIDGACTFAIITYKILQ